MFCPTKSAHFWDAAGSGNLSKLHQLLQDETVNPQFKWGPCGDTPFIKACREGQVPAVKFFLALPPGRIDVNLAHALGATPLYIACQEGHKEIVALLLADLRIDVNKAELLGFTPFYLACQNGLVEIVELLLGNSRVDVNKPIRVNATPLWIAAKNGYLTVVQLLLGSDRWIDTRVTCHLNHLTAAEMARCQATRNNRYGFDDWEEVKRGWEDGQRIADLIDRYEENPVKVSLQVRRILKAPLAGEIFALVIFLCDAFLSLNPTSQETHPQTLQTLRFFKIIIQLPLDLQMLLCNRVVGLSGSFIPSSQSERGFRKLSLLLGDSQPLLDQDAK